MPIPTAVRCSRKHLQGIYIALQIWSSSLHVRPARRCQLAGQPRSPPRSAATGADAPSRNGRLLPLVRTLIAYGRHLAAALQQRTSATDLADITRHFGIVDIGEILASITRGLLRAAALEAKLVSHPSASRPP